jgi:hypothetical protein
MLHVEVVIKHFDKWSKEMFFFLWKDLYALPNRSLWKVKQVIKNHIRVEVNILRHEPTCFY